MKFIDLYHVDAKPVQHNIELSEIEKDIIVTKLYNGCQLKGITVITDLSLNQKNIINGHYLAFYLKLLEHYSCYFINLKNKILYKRINDLVPFEYYRPDHIVDFVTETNEDFFINFSEFFKYRVSNYQHKDNMITTLAKKVGELNAKLYYENYVNISKSLIETEIHFQRKVVQNYEELKYFTTIYNKKL